MLSLNKKQKIALGVILTIVLGVFSYFMYVKDSEFEEINIIEANSVDIQNSINSTNEEKYNNIIIHMSGAVKNEGIVELSENSRIADAIEKAGGLREDADMEKINLAYVVEDGMKIYIPSINDKENELDNNLSQENSKDETSKYVSSSRTNSNISTSSKSYQSNKVNINTATQTELETLPGIGPSTALKIINYRNENGKFNSIEDIKNVSGIGDVKFEKIKDFIVV